MITEPRLIKWRPNILKNPWSDNVVTIGLGQGFIDPLESNGLYLIVFSITMLVKMYIERFITRSLQSNCEKSSTE